MEDGVASKHLTFHARLTALNPPGCGRKEAEGRQKEKLRRKKAGG